MKDCKDITVRPMKLMVTIVNRGRGEAIAEYYTKEGVCFHLLCYGKGTASSGLLELLGLSVTEKDVLLSAISVDDVPRVFAHLKENTLLQKAGKGIVFTIPMDSVRGKKGLRALMGQEEI